MRMKRQIRAICLLVCAGALMPVKAEMGALPDVPKTLAPKPGARTFLPFPHFAWTADPQAFQSVAQPVRYDIQIGRDNGFLVLADEDTVCLNRYVHDRPLPAGHYFWRVRARGGDGRPGAWSAPAEFAVAPCDHDVRVACDPSGGDCLPAVEAALAKARELGASGASVRVAFEKGTYRFDAPGKPLLNAENLRNVIIDGCGSTVLPARVSSGLVRGTHAESVVVAGFAVDYRTERTFLQGRVVGVDKPGQRVLVRLEPGEPDYDTPYVKKGLAFLSLLDPQVDGRLKADAANAFFFEKIAKAGDGTWALTLRGRHGGTFFQAGDRFVHFVRENGAVLCAFAQSSNITIYDMVSCAAGSLHYTDIEGSVFNVLHCRWAISEGRWFSGNADGVHCRGLAVGPWIEGCDIQSIGDDGIALYARPCCLAEARPEAKKNTCVCKPDFFNLEAGDEVAFFNPLEGRILLECVVVSVAKLDGGNYRVAFDRDIPEQVTVLGSKPVNKTFGSGDLQRCTQIWNRSKSCGDFVIRHNTIRNIRRFGTVFRARRGVVESNAYTAASSSGVAFVNEPFYPNGLYCSDIVIRGNTFSGCAFERAPLGAVALRFVSAGKSGAADRGPRRVLIDDNVFEECLAPEVVLGSARDIVLRSNAVKRHGAAAALSVKETNTENVVVLPPAQP